MAGNWHVGLPAVEAPARSALSLYPAAYSLLRFDHEFLQVNPKILGSISGYQIAALAVTLLGIVGFADGASDLDSFLDPPKLRQ
jgi:hypothetical protein